MQKVLERGDDSFFAQRETDTEALKIVGYIIMSIDLFW